MKYANLFIDQLFLWSPPQINRIDTILYSGNMLKLVLATLNCILFLDSVTCVQITRNCIDNQVLVQSYVSSDALLYYIIFK